MDNVIIIAGGAGHRLWPMSHNERPKYLLRFGKNSSLFLDSLHRAFAINPQRVIVVTHHEHVNAVCDEISACDTRHRQRITVLGEPHIRNTAPAIALAVRYLRATHGGGSTMCLPADHIIHPLDAFIHDVHQCEHLIAADLIAVFGIKPTRPEQGYGYIERDKAITGGYMVNRFHEKPHRDQAIQYLQSARYYWNSGIFAFDADMFWNELQRHHADIPRQFEQAGDTIFNIATVDHIQVHQQNDALTALYQRISPISIDYAVAERSRAVGVVEAHFNWHDLGSWDEVATLIEEKTLPHRHAGRVEQRESARNVVISDQPVALCGINDTIVIVNDGKILICARGHSQTVKDIAVRMRAPSAHTD